MKKSLYLLILCCFSATTYSLNVNTEFTEIKSSDITTINKIEIDRLSLNNFKIFDSDDLRPKFRIGFDAPQIDHRQILLTIDANATDGVDWGYDAQLYQILNDDMYWVINENKYVIQATNEIVINKEIPLGVVTTEGGVISIGVDALENSIEGIKVCLKDKELNKIYDIEETNYQITLAAGEYHNRFAILFVSTESIINEDDLNFDLDIVSDGDGEEEEVEEEDGDDYVVHDINETPNNSLFNHQFKIYVSNGKNILNIRNKELIKVNYLILYNDLGQEAKVWSTNLNQKQLSLQVNVKKGVYTIQAVTEIGNISKRVIISHI